MTDRKFNPQYLEVTDQTVALSPSDLIFYPSDREGGYHGGPLAPDLGAGCVCCYHADRFGIVTLFVLVATVAPESESGHHLIAFPRLRFDDGQPQLGQDHMVDFEATDHFLASYRGRRACGCYTGQGYSGCDCLTQPLSHAYGRTFQSVESGRYRVFKAPLEPPAGYPFYVHLKTMPEAINLCDLPLRKDSFLFCE